VVVIIIIIKMGGSFTWASLGLDSARRQMLKVVYGSESLVQRCVS
jgi:hypothetical protein